jgi:hypothetical protein
MSSMCSLTQEALMRRLHQRLFRVLLLAGSPTCRLPLDRAGTWHSHGWPEQRQEVLPDDQVLPEQESC